MMASKYFKCLVPGCSQAGDFLSLFHCGYWPFCVCLSLSLILTRPSILHLSKVWDQERFSLGESAFFKQKTSKSFTEHSQLILVVNIYYPEGFHPTEFQRSFASS